MPIANQPKSIALEVIAVNNGSTDSTLEILNNIASIDARLIVFSQKNKGPAGSRQTGLENATGDLICWVDADDWVEEEWLESMLIAMETSHADVLVTKCTIEKDYNSTTYNPKDEKIIEKWTRDEAIDAFLEHKKLTGTLWTKMIKRDLFNGVSFNLDQWYWEDMSVVWKVLLKSNKVVKTSAAYYHWWLHEDSMCMTPLSEQRIKDSLYVADLFYYDCCNEKIMQHQLLATKVRIQRYFNVISQIVLRNLSYPYYEQIIVTALKNEHFLAYKSLKLTKDKILLCMILLSKSMTKRVILGLKKTFKK